ncbi:glycogen/starch synthase [Hydrogenimonas thermophila]|uniref:glycogen synthase n=1 Tax=Hydrogenimonas thermophila TaxID=223786 RepID=UPI0029371924|nr:glycogen/starch synthase [Hydrogenimonas thermophila]WOE69176.1 glycogen/starch synthase [Hydrogenimonas thermophila]WOE71686.1 glycogen/starch synthase [Hydrogenimonas thermophila]
MKLLFASAEIFPFAKSGGLADISFALSKALNKKNSVTAIMPLYRCIDKTHYDIRSTGECFNLYFWGVSYDIELFTTTIEDLKVVFIYNELLCERDFLYGPSTEGYEDNDLRFAIFCHAIVEIVKRGFFEILHLNDWHTALAALLARDAGVNTKIIYTIHNLAYQGLFPKSSMVSTGIDPKHFRMEEVEFYGEVNWMKAGIGNADAVTTVSPSYAVQIQTPEFGCGLDGFLRVHREKLTGILNGIDTKLFDPSTDPMLPSTYSKTSKRGKSVCKKRFFREIEIDQSTLPLFIFIGRFVEQKGLELIIEAIEEMLKRPLVFAMLGDGEEKYHSALQKVAKKESNFHLHFGYDETLAHKMYAAADFLVMPSLFEPCGLNQMIAMRYGTIPLVHKTGGLRDTVHQIIPRKRVCGMGFVFDKMTKEVFLQSIDDALELYANRSKLNSIRTFNMSCDFSIQKCAKEYLKLYESLL